MKNIAPALFTVLLAVLLAGVITGCATAHIDWNARVGHYTFDQAIVDFGPPDRESHLSSGQTVAKWVTRYEGGSAVVVGGGFHTRVIETVPSYYESSLILTFSSDRILTAWRER